MKSRLKNISTRAPKKEDKETAKKEIQKLKTRLEELQNLLYAESRHALLIVIQGMDASGKDGTVKNVFDAVNPMGCRAISFKAPSSLEAKHDFLWRIHRQAPEKGMMVIFNRSHYEDVLIQRVHLWVDEKTIRQRYDHINNFEKLLVDSGTTVLKFYLHISKEEQRLRLEERSENPAKMWKYNKQDFKERKYWDEYMESYERVFEHCSKHVPWNIVPADQNWYKEYVIAKNVVDTLEGLSMKFPGMKPEKKLLPGAEK